MDEHRKERKKAIQNITTVSEYHSYMDKFKLSPRERMIADCVFLKAMSYIEIAEQIGYSERSVKRAMKRILSVI